MKLSVQWYPYQCSLKDLLQACRFLEDSRHLVWGCKAFLLACAQVKGPLLREELLCSSLLLALTPELPPQVLL